MVVMDKMVDEDRRNADADADNQLTPTESSRNASAPAQVTLPDGSTTRLGPSAKDAYSVFEDLCLLANSEKPNFLKLEFLHKTFALELIESVLTNYHALFRKVALQMIVCYALVTYDYAAHLLNPPPTKPPLPSTPQSIIRSSSIPTHPPMHSRGVPPSQAVFV